MVDKINNSSEVISNLNGFPETLQAAINKIIKDEGYIDYVLRNNSDTKNEHFLGEVFKVDINGKTADGVKETALFVKRKVVFEKIKLTDVAEVYTRELFVYNDLSRLCNRLQDEAKIPENERFKFVKSYDSDRDTVILENVAKKGYKTYHRRDAVQKKFVELSIIAMAKFHGLSFVIGKKYPNYFDEKIKSIKHSFNLDSDWSRFVDNLCEVSGKVLKGEIGDKVKNYAPRLKRQFRNILQLNKPIKGCMCHGDYKILNILVKEKDGEPTEVCPIDYQLIYYGSPVEDFVAFIFSATDREFRRQHLNYLKELYFETLSKFLKYFDVDVESTYSRAQFEEDYKERCEFGLIFGLFVGAFTFVRIDEGFDTHKMSLSELPLIPDEMFEGRIRGLVEDFVEWGYL